MGSKWTLGRSVGGCVEWIQLAQDRDRWRAVVNAVMNLRVLAPRSLLISTILTSGVLTTRLAATDKTAGSHTIQVSSTPASHSGGPVSNLRPQSGHPQLNTSRLSRNQALAVHSTRLTPNDVIHDVEPVPSTCHPHNLFP
jgi:hypothetical protein